MGILDGTKILETTESPINGKLEVIKTLAFGTYIQAQGLTQSGGVVYDIWKQTLNRIKMKKFDMSNCLILGLGGGSAALLVRKLWPKAKITGVDIDPLIVDLGRKYLSLDNLGITAVVKDAEEYCLEKENEEEKFDLILIDMYVGHEVPKKFQTEEFVNKVKILLDYNGTAIFNRLYSDEKRKESLNFGDRLNGKFKDVEFFYPQANIEFICSL